MSSVARSGLQQDGELARSRRRGAQWSGRTGLHTRSRPARTDSTPSLGRDRGAAGSPVRPAVVQSSSKPSERGVSSTAQVRALAFPGVGL